MGFIVNGDLLASRYSHRSIVISTRRESALHLQEYDPWSVITELHFPAGQGPVPVSKLGSLRVDAPPIGHLAFDIVVDFWLLPSSSGYEYLDISPDPPKDLVLIGLDESGYSIMAVSHDAVRGINEHSLRYALEASPANCGAPVLDAAWRIVAIHIGVDASSGHTWGLRLAPLLLHARRRLSPALP